MDNRKIHKIKLEEIDTDKKKSAILEVILWKLYQSGTKKALLKADEIHVIDNISFTLNHDMVIRWKKKLGRDNQYYFEPHGYVLAKQLDVKGGLNYGLYMVQGVLTFDKNSAGSLLYTADNDQHKKRLIKIQLFPIFKNEITPIKKQLKIASLYHPLHARHVIEIVDSDIMFTFTKMKLLAKNNVEDLLEKNNILNIEQRLIVTHQLLKALQKLHAAEIIHRDIKPENMINDIDEMRLYFVDFDSAKRQDVDVLRSITPEFASPELILDFLHAHNTGYIMQADKQSDIYQIGLILFELWGGNRRKINWYEEMGENNLFSELNKADLDNLFSDFKNDDSQKIIDIKATITSLIEYMLEPNLERRMKNVDEAISMLHTGLAEYNLLPYPENTSDSQLDEVILSNKRELNNYAEKFLLACQDVSLQQLYLLKVQFKIITNVILSDVKTQFNDEIMLHNENIEHAFQAIKHHARLLDKQIDKLFLLQSKRDNLLEIINLLLGHPSDQSQYTIVQLQSMKKMLEQLNDFYRLNSLQLKSLKLLVAEYDETIKALASESELSQFLSAFIIDKPDNANHVLKNALKTSILNYLATHGQEEISNLMPSFEKIIELCQYYYGSPHGLLNRIKFVADSSENDHLKNIIHSVMKEYKQSHSSYFLGNQKIPITTNENYTSSLNLSNSSFISDMQSKQPESSSSSSDKPSPRSNKKKQQ